MFIDAAVRANAPTGNETSAEQLERYKKYFREMYLYYGGKWLDDYLQEHTSFIYDDPDELANEIQGMSNLIEINGIE